MNPIVLIYAASKLAELFVVLIIRLKWLWIGLLLVEGMLSITMDQSILRSVILYDPAKEYERAILHEIECMNQEKAEMPQ